MFGAVECRLGGQMRTLSLFVAGAFAAATLGTSTASAEVMPISSGAQTGSFCCFGASEETSTQTVGQVFTPGATGMLSSFTLYLDEAIGGQLYGGIGVWNGSSDFTFGGGVSSTLFTSAAVAADHSGAYTFAPNVELVAGSRYVAYLSVFGADHTNQAPSFVQLAGGMDAPDTPFNYIVYNNVIASMDALAPSGNPGSTAWNYDLDITGNANAFGGNALRMDAVITAIPEPASWALMIGGFGMAGAILRRRRALALAA